jgi:hypothetical protein
LLSNSPYDLLISIDNIGLVPYNPKLLYTMKERAGKVRNFLASRKTPSSENTSGIHAVSGQRGGASKEPLSTLQPAISEKTTRGVLAGLPQRPDGVAGLRRRLDAHPAEATPAKVSQDGSTRQQLAPQQEVQPGIRITPEAFRALPSEPTGVGALETRLIREEQRARKKRRKTRTLQATAALAVGTALAACSSAGLSPNSTNAAQKSVDCKGSITEPYVNGSQQQAGREVLFTFTADAQHAFVVFLPKGVQVNVEVNGQETTVQSSDSDTALVLETSGQADLLTGKGLAACVYPPDSGGSISNSVATNAPRFGYDSSISQTVFG